MAISESHFWITIVARNDSCVVMQPDLSVYIAHLGPSIGDGCPDSYLVDHIGSRRAVKSLSSGLAGGDWPAESIARLGRLNPAWGTCSVMSCDSCDERGDLAARL